MSFDLPAALAALPGFPQLRAPRVRLRGPREEDVEAIFAVFSDPAVARFWSRPPMVVHDEAHAMIDDMLEAFAERGKIGWAIVDKDDAAIGTCTLFNFDARHRRAELGYALRSDRWGQGLAREATSAALDWAFRALRLHRVEADIDPRNDASRRILERLGFASEGVLRERFFVGDTATDSEIFGLLAEDWLRRET